MEQKKEKANGVKWYGYVAWRDDDNVLKRALMLEVNGPRKRGRPKQTRMIQVEENVKGIGLEVEEAANWTRWKKGVRAIDERMRCIRPPSVTRKKSGLKLGDNDDEKQDIIRAFTDQQQNFKKC